MDPQLGFVPHVMRYNEDLVFAAIVQNRDLGLAAIEPRVRDNNWDSYIASHARALYQHLNPFLEDIRDTWRDMRLVFRDTRQAAYAPIRLFANDLRSVTRDLRHFARNERRTIQAVALTTSIIAGAFFMLRKE